MAATAGDDQQRAAEPEAGGGAPSGVGRRGRLPAAASAPAAAPRRSVGAAGRRRAAAGRPPAAPRRRRRLRGAAPRAAAAGIGRRGSALAAAAPPPGSAAAASGVARHLREAVRRDVARAGPPRPWPSRARAPTRPAGRGSPRRPGRLLAEQVVGERARDLARQAVARRERGEPGVGAGAHGVDGDAEQGRDVVVGAPLLQHERDDGALVGGERLERAHRATH